MGFLRKRKSDRRRKQIGEVSKNTITIVVTPREFRRLKNPKPVVIAEISKTPYRDTSVFFKQRRIGPADRRKEDRRKENKAPPYGRDRRKPGRDRRG